MDSEGESSASVKIGGDMKMKGVNVEGVGSTMGCLGSSTECDTTIGGTG